MRDTEVDHGHTDVIADVGGERCGRWEGRKTCAVRDQGERVDGIDGPPLFGVRVGDGE